MDKQKQQPHVPLVRVDIGKSVPTKKTGEEPTRAAVAAAVASKFTGSSISDEVKIGSPKTSSSETKQKTQLSEALKSAVQLQQTTPPEKMEKVPVIDQAATNEPVTNTAVPRTRPPRPKPSLDQRPLVLSIHLVPSLPIGLFEVLADAIEAATNKPVVLIHEARTDRPVAKGVVDIAILPAGEDWQDGNLMPISFVFEHRLNKSFSPAVYADVVVATDRAPHVEDIMDLRGHRCALPDRRRSVGAATLLFNHLRSKGEGPSFFGNTLDANSQMAALQMVAGKQVEVCILESPVIKFHRKSLPGVYSLHILSSLGPLPPYPIMVNKSMPSDVVDKIKDYLLNIRQDTEWMEKFAPYSLLGFAEYSKSLFDVQEIKTVPTSAPYY